MCGGFDAVCDMTRDIAGKLWVSCAPACTGVACVPSIEMTPRLDWSEEDEPKQAHNPGIADRHTEAVN
jgi:hypothetical protein